MINSAYLHNGGETKYSVFTPPAGDLQYGMILYCDGGARPNPIFGGWGIHGYLHSPDKPKQGVGLSDNVVTSTGYLKRVEFNAMKEGDQRKPKEVTPHIYVDGYGSFNGNCSNNVAELVAVTHGLCFADEHVLKTVQIYTDSEYVSRGFYGWVPNCRKNNWMKDGEVAKNAEYWKNLCAAYDRLINRGVNVQITWIAAHSGHLGNELADALATVGVMASRAAKYINVIDTTPAKGYWKSSFEKHPFLNHPCMYFNTLTEHLTRGHYYFGNCRDFDIWGMRVSDGAYSVVQLQEPEETLEVLRNHQSAMSGGVDTVVAARLDKLWRPETIQQVSKYGSFAMVQANRYKLDLQCLDKEPLTIAADPPKLAYRAEEAINSMANHLQQYLDGNKRITVTDLTPIIYETSTSVDKKGASVTKLTLRPEYTVGYASTKVDARYASGDVVKAVAITLTLGIDLLDRNSLKRLEESSPKVSLITWLEAPGVFRYATVVESGKDKGIWAGWYSNLRVVSPEEDAAAAVA